jgi:chondroitin AC lyase
MKKRRNTNFPRFYLILFFCVLILSACFKQPYKSNNKLEYPANLKQLHENVMNHHVNLPVDPSHIEKLLSDLQKDGSWPSIDYTDVMRGGWPVKIHLQYVQDLAIAYQAKNSGFHHDKNTLEKIHLSLNYWLNNDFLSKNWWDQHIGVPELLLPTLFLMEGEISEDQKNKAMVLLYRAKIKMTGQNKVWLSANVMLRSLFLKKSDSVAIASNAIQGELEIADGVGIKADWSYHEHGAQLQFGNYGLSYLEDMIKWYTIVHGTPFQFQDNKIEVLRNYTLKGQQWVIWNKKMDISASGRQLFPDEQSNKYLRVKACIEKMEVLDKAYADEYKNAANSNVLSGNKHFWESEFQVHRRPEFYFSIKMSSERVIGTESVNEENIKGYYLGDGVTQLNSNGDEYYNIPPFWDWKKLPGTTTIQDNSDLPIIKFSDFKTKSTFVGGVSNGDNGIAVMGYDRDSLMANKSWFMFNDKIVCLGSGINSNTKYNVTTTINQVFLKQKVLVSKDNNITEKKENKPIQNPYWILHDSTGYFFPNGGLIKSESRFLEGSWNKVVKRLRPIILTESILKIWFDHGSSPKDKDYSYILVPNATSKKMEELYKNSPFKIVNSKTLQSVETSDGNLAGIVFYIAGSSNIFGGIATDKPCLIMLEKINEDIKFSLSDPSHTLKNINLILNGKYQGEFATINNDKTFINLTLPEGNLSGKTVEVLLEKNH